jgi:protein TonB
MTAAIEPKAKPLSKPRPPISVAIPAKREPFVAKRLEDSVRAPQESMPAADRPAGAKPLNGANRPAVSTPLGQPSFTTAWPETSSGPPGGQNAAVSSGNGSKMAAEAYFQVVRERIAQKKTYPLLAVDRQLEGQVTVRFTIAADGRVSEINIVTSSRRRVLDRAAIATVKAASPFPRPPESLFHGPIQLSVPIVFRLS